MAEAAAAQRREVPHSVEAEQWVLGTLLQWPECWDEVSGLVDEPAFWLAQHRVIWRAVHSLVAATKAVDVITVFDELARHGRAQDAGGLPYLQQLVEAVPSPRSVRGTAEVVRRHARTRALQAVLADACTHLAGAAGPDEVIDSLMARLLEMQQGLQLSQPQPMQVLLPGWIDQLQERAAGHTDAVPTGLVDVDRVLGGGPRPGELVVIGARPSMGKSALAHTLARNVARVGPVLVCSLEDSAGMLVSRQVAAVGRVNLADIRRPDRAGDAMWAGVTAAVQELGELPIYIDDSAVLRLADVRRKCLQVRQHAGRLCMVMVDYLQLMDGEGETRAYQLAGIARALKRMAKELLVPVVLLSQVSREADKLSGPPRLDHLAESGGIEQAADVIGLLWREARHKETDANRHQAQVEFVKNKNGATDTVRLFFDGATQRFEDAA